MDINLSPAAPRVGLKIFLSALGLAVLFAILIFFLDGLYVQWYRGRVYPGVSVGAVSLAGLNHDQIVQFIQNINNRLSKEGITLTVHGGEEAWKEKLPLVTDSDSAVELARLDGEALARNALSIGRAGGWRNFVDPLLVRTTDRVHLVAPVTIDHQAVSDMLTSVLGKYETVSHNAGFVFPNIRDLSIVSTTAENAGSEFDRAAIIQRLKTQLEAVSLEPIGVATKPVSPTITHAEALEAAKLLPYIFALGPIELSYIDPTTRERHDWKISPTEFAAWLEVKHDSDNKPIVGLKREEVENYFDSDVRHITDVSAENAKFVVEDGKVKEFQGSRSGVGVDTAKTYNDIAVAFETRNYPNAAAPKTTNISVQIVEPTIKTADVNSLGITDVIGVGVSTFYGSHTNRIKNITTAVKRLNGTLIKPGEVFSSNKYAGPYIPENGFLPELVIKGNKIEKEIGGGMCQIGTTLFRMAMNSGMPIAERHNHSLVVNYYLDPVNKNPGTDATLYDPVLDFKFVNDSGGYLLLQTDVDYKKQQLTFTLWGKPDGRSGSYTHPTVTKWIKPGEQQNIPDTQGTVKPGEEQCQEAYTGALATFTYTRFTSTSEKIVQQFDSYYRPLPKICIVGASTSTAGGSESLGEPGQ